MTKLGMVKMAMGEDGMTVGINLSKQKNPAESFKSGYSAGD